MTRLLLVVPSPVHGSTTTLAVFQDQGTAQPVVQQGGEGKAVRRDDPSAAPAPTGTQGGDPKQPASATDPMACFRGDQLWMILAMVAVFYFLLIRPAQKQEKKRRELNNALKRGDRVVMASGIHGEVLSLDNQTVTLKVDRDVKLVFDRATVQRVLGDDSAAAEAAKAEPKK